MRMIVRDGRRSGRWWNVGHQIDEIDQYAKWSTIDKVRFRKSDQGPWHFYSSKPPFLSTIVAALYAVERNIQATDSSMTRRSSAAFCC
ncbi:MAG: hypothetical protein U0996_06765 [Planctomycetaceae bacterium]